MRIFPIITSLLVVFALYVFIMQRDMFSGNATDPSTEEHVNTAREDNPAVHVVVKKIKAENVQSQIVLRGKTEAARNITVRAETSGLVISVPLRKGHSVNEGDLLCELEKGTRESTLAQAKAQLQEAERNAVNAEKLEKRGVGSENAVLAAKTALESAHAAFSQAEKELERVTIKAPFNGLLESDSAELGSLLQPGSTCAEIISLDPIKLVGFANEAEVAQLSIGMTAQARLISGALVEGQISFVSRSADEQTRTFRIEMTLPNPNNLIPDGATAEILIALDGIKGHLIPLSALTLDDHGSLGVRLAENGVAKFQEVQAIRDEQNGIWVRGLPDEADIIVVGQEFVTDGRKIVANINEGAE